MHIVHFPRNNGKWTTLTQFTLQKNFVEKFSLHVCVTYEQNLLMFAHGINKWIFFTFIANATFNLKKCNGIFLEVLLKIRIEKNR